MNAEERLRAVRAQMAQIAYILDPNRPDPKPKRRHWLARVEEWANDYVIAPTPVFGWLYQYSFTLAGVALAWYGRAEYAPSFLVGGAIIQVIRVIEKERRREP